MVTPLPQNIFFFNFSDGFQVLCILKQMSAFGVRTAKLCQVAHALDEISTVTGRTSGTSLEEPQLIHVT